jgi:enoyl-CoA hydratase/carnithine racemase
MNLRIEQDGRLRRITLAAPEKRNLLDAELCRDLLRDLRDAATDEGTGAILIEADGQVFCSGVEQAPGTSCSPSAAPSPSPGGGGPWRRGLGRWR